MPSYLNGIRRERPEKLVFTRAVLFVFDLLHLETACSVSFLFFFSLISERFSSAPHVACIQFCNYTVKLSKRVHLCGKCAALSRTTLSRHFL